MTRIVPAALASHIAGTTTSLSSGLKIKRTDGVVIALTDSDIDFTLDLGDGDGARVYKAATAYGRSEFDARAGLTVDNMNVVGMLDAAAITDTDLRAGRFDFAEVTVFLVNRAVPADGTIRAATGWLGEVRLLDYGHETEIRGLAQALTQAIVDIVRPDCPADLGDSRCQVRLDPPTWAATTAYTVRQPADAATGHVVKPVTQNARQFKCTTAGTSGASEPSWNTTVGGTTSDGSAVWTTILALSQAGTVATVTDLRQFTATGVSLGADHWTEGLVKWLTGLNAALNMEVKTDSGAGALTLILPMPFAIQVGDTFKVQAGCRKRLLEDCVAKFDNAENFQGFAFVPGIDVTFGYPDAR